MFLHQLYIKPTEVFIESHAEHDFTPIIYLANGIF